MVPLIVLAVSFAVFYVMGRLGVAQFRNPVVCLRWAVAAMFLVTASAHFGSRRPDLVRMVPPGFPAPGLLVTLTGLAQLAGAIGLTIPRLARPAAICLALLLIAMFLANIHAAREGLSIGGDPVTPLVPRTVMQAVFIAATLTAGLARRGVHMRQAQG